MASAEFVDTFQLWLFSNRPLRREAAAAICGSHADASAFSLGQGHQTFLELFSRLNHAWGALNIVTVSCVTGESGITLGKKELA